MLAYDRRFLLFSQLRSIHMDNQPIGNFVRLVIHQHTSLESEPFVISVSHRPTPSSAESNISPPILLSSTVALRAFLSAVGANGLFRWTSESMQLGSFETTPCTVEQFMALLAEGNNRLPQSITLIALNTSEEEIKKRLTLWRDQQIHSGVQPLHR